MRRIDALRTLALSSALILALGGTGGASAEDTSDTGELTSVEAAPAAEAPEEAADDGIMKSLVSALPAALAMKGGGGAPQAEHPDQEGGQQIEREALHRLRNAGLRFNAVFSHGQYLDVLPIRASKGKAIRYLAHKWGIPVGNILVAGDSGNDREMLKGRTKGVVVGNYSEELESLKGLPRIYFARQEFASGILEGISHYAFLDPKPKPADKA